MAFTFTTSQFDETTYQIPRNHSLQQAITEVNKQVQEAANVKASKKRSSYDRYDVKMKA